MAEKNLQAQFRPAMQPLPELTPYVRTVALHHSNVSLFAYDTQAGGDLPLLFVHGLGDEADTWRRVLPALAAHRRVIAIDLPGFGRSDKPDAPYSVPWYADILRDLLDTLQIGRVVLIGHSLGAVTSHWLALESPERVAGLMLLAGGLAVAPQKLSLNTLWMLTPGIGEWLYTRLRKNPQAAYASLRPFYADIDALPQRERDFLFQRVNERVQSDEQRRAFFRTLRGLVRWLPAQQEALAGRLASFATPTTVLWGDLDAVSSVENGRVLATMQPGAQLTVLHGAGHNLQQEHAETVIDAISALRSRLSPAA